MNTYDFAQILNWVEGRLAADAAQEIEAYLETADAETQSLLAWLRNFQHLSQEYLLVAPPADLEEKLYNIFTRQPKTKQQPGFFQRLLASLTFDSYQQLAAAGVRAASTRKSERQLVYSAETADITLDLHWLIPEKQIGVYGQLFPADEMDETIYTVDLQKDDESLALIQTDELGKFTFPALRPGTYDIIFSGDQWEIALTGVTLRI